MTMSNPVCEFIDGSTDVAFTYDPGPAPVLYHVGVHVRTRPDGGSGYVLANVVLFAQDEDHVHRIMLAACDFKEDTERRYAESISGRPSSASEYLLDARKAKTAKLRELIEARAYTVEPAPTNQLMKVGWASNDTI